MARPHYRAAAFEALALYLLTGAACILVGSSMTHLMDHFGVSLAQVAAIQSAYALGRMSTVFLTGWITERFGVRTSLLLGTAKGIDGPYTKGTYLWVEVENWKRLEAKLVEGPYIHHCVGIHKDVVPVLFEACKYLGVKPDLYDNNEEQVKAYLRGE